MLDGELWLKPVVAALVAGQALLWLRPGTRGLAWRWQLEITGAWCLVLTVIIVSRWVRLGHGPFLSMYEILLSNLWSLGIVFMVFSARFVSLRGVSMFVMPVLALLAVWLLVVPAADNQLPPSYATIWLVFHVTFGKIYLGTLMIAMATAMSVLVGRERLAYPSGNGPPGDEYLIEFAHGCLMLSFIFNGLMLIVGALWAQDAWGRYWDWDPLETWALFTWLCQGFVLHARHQHWLPVRAHLASIVVVFVLAFLTFFGLPFVSVAPHQGIM